MADLARVLESIVGICKRGLGTTKDPKGAGPIAQGRYTNVLSKSRPQRTMLGRIVKRDCMVVVRLALDNVSCLHQRRSLQHYLGHRNITHTVRYSELSPDRFKDFWKD